MIMEDRSRIEFKLTIEEKDYIDEIKDSYGLSNRNYTLSKIISEHKGLEIEKDLKNISKDIQCNKSILNKIDKNIKIFLEIMNSISIQENYEIFIPTSEYESELLRGSKEEIEKKINKDVIKTLDKKVY